MILLLSKLIKEIFYIKWKLFVLKFKDNDANIPSFRLLCLNEHPHITIGAFSNGKPVESNYIKKWVGIKPIEVKTILKMI